MGRPRKRVEDQVSARSDGRPTTQERLYRFIREQEIVASMTSADRSADAYRGFLTSRADYYGPDGDWERQLRDWELAHPYWPIGRHVSYE